MARNWEWDEFDRQVEREVAEIRERLGIGSLDEAGKEAAADELLDTGVRASQEADEVGAAAAFRVAVAVDSSRWKAHYNLGWLYLTIGNRIHPPLTRKPGPAKGSPSPTEPPLVALGERAVFYNQAIRNLKRVLQLNIQLGKGWCLLGQAQYYLGQYEEARASLRKAIDVDPDGEGGRMAADSLAVLEDSLKEDET